MGTLRIATTFYVTPDTTVTFRREVDWVAYRAEIISLAGVTNARSKESAELP
jgi:hypothetical protein